MSHLILQGPRLDSAIIEKIAAVVQADGVQELGPTAVRLLGADDTQRAEVQALCKTGAMDFAFLEQIDRLKEMRVLAMDMDSTLINIECIDEIADMAGRKEQVATITEAAMRGEIKDFTESLNRRVAFLEGVPVSDLTRVYEERLQPNLGADRLIATAHAHGTLSLSASRASVRSPGRTRASSCTARRDTCLSGSRAPGNRRWRNCGWRGATR